jgi:VCBS repeat-containing protein
VGTADITVPEGNDAVFAVEVSKAAIGSTLTLTLADGTALDADYFADPANGGKFQYSTDGGTTWIDVTGPIALNPGNTNLLVSTDTIDDLIDEANETFTLTGKLTSNGSDYSDTATATIIDNDIESATVSVSEEGLVNGIKDTDGVIDTTDNAKVSGTINLNDINNANITLIAPTTNLMSNGQIIVWTGTGTKELVGKIGTTEVIKVNINDNGEYTVELLQAVTHPVNSIEDIVSLNIGVKAADGTFTSTGTLVVNIEDDMPTSCTVEREINIEKDVIIVKNLQAGFKDSVYLNGTNEVTNTNTDADNYIDKIEWGLQTSESSGQSGYSLVDSNDYTTSTGTLINTNGLFKVADFTHQNWILSSNSSILEKTTLTMKMDITINGKTVPVEFEALLNHTETPNSGDPIASRDIITLVDTDIIVNVLGQDYIFAIEGFKDSNGNYVKTIYTDEAANNTYGIFASVKPVEALPVVEGNVCGEAGADGLDKVEWGDLTSPYGTMTVDANGKYTFIVNQATKDNLAGGDSLSQTFTYSIIDKDGDKSSSTVTIKINGSDAPVINAIPTAIDETNTLAFGQASTNLVVTLDVSGSMATKVKDSSGKDVPRFNIEIDSMIKTIQAYKVNGKTEVNLTLFADGAKNIGWMSADAAINYLSKLTLTSSSIKYDGQSISGLSTGGTDYDSALKSTMSINFSGHNADSTVAYFLSDGAPNKNTSNTDSDSDQTIKNWKAFINENIDTLNVVGVGSGAKVDPLKIVQVQAGDKVIMAIDDSTLGTILLGTVTVSSSGDVFDNIFGGDGAIKIDSIIVDGTTYNASNYTATNIATINNWQGTLEFNFSTGKYTYTTDSSQFSTDSVKTFKVNASDVDGDVASFKVNIKVDVTPNESKDIISIDNDDTIDLTSVINSSNTNKTDIIDITNGKINTLKIDMSDVVDLVDADKELIIKGDLGDKVDLDTPSDWSNAGKTQLDGTNYKVFTGTGINSTIKLLIEDDIDVTPDI